MKNNKLKYKYRPNDMFYDIESIENVFTVAQIFPNGKQSQKGGIISILDDGYTDINGKHHPKIIKSKEDEQFIIDKIKSVNTSLQSDDIKILFEYLNIVKPKNIQITSAAEIPFYGTLLSFIKRFGLEYYRKNKTNNNAYGGYRVPKDFDINRNKSIDNMISEIKNNKTSHETKNFIKSNSIEYADILSYKFDENINGRYFGYNSFNYDMTMLAYFFDALPFDIKVKSPSKLNDSIENPITAEYLRNFNNLLFESHIKNMSDALVVETNAAGKEIRNYNKGYAIKKSWAMSNRFIDVARLNEKLSKVALKRLSGVLGLPIIESDELSGNETGLNDIRVQIKNEYNQAILDENGNPKTKIVTALERLANLLAYNVSDVINTQELFEQSVYQSGFEVKSKLIEKYPQVIYGELGDTNKPDTNNIDNLRSLRLCVDSTSASFIKTIIAPYHDLKDIPSISYMYPGKEQAKKLGIKQFNVLDVSLDWATKNIPNGYAAFKPVYDYYKLFEGKSVNDSIKSENDEKGITTIDSSYLKTKNEGQIYFYRDANGNKTSSIVKFSTGGIHGAEIKLDLFLEEIIEWETLNKHTNELKTFFNNDAALAYGYKGSSEKELKDNAKTKLGGFIFKFSDSSTSDIKSYLKSGATRKNADWKIFPKPSLYDSDGKIKNKYQYTSVAKANHEDFSSYYPLLLTMLEVFKDKKYNTDIYADIYHGRVEIKNKLKTIEYDTMLYIDTNLEQLALKLLLNAASGEGDTNFKSSIKVNNAIVSMRIIGQLFAWRIGQAEALAGARIPSTNTDGLYTMDISLEKNNKILEETVKDLYIKVDGESVSRFVSKDANNRLELYGDDIESAKGGSLTSHKGPTVTNNLNHPAAIDYALAQYLAFEDDPCNKPFDRKRGAKYLGEIFTKFDNETALKYFQWIVAASVGKHTFPYILYVDNKTNTAISYKPLQHYSRLFITIPKSNVSSLIKKATSKKLQSKSIIKRYKELKTNNIDDIINHDAIAKIILKENNYEPHANGEHDTEEANSEKITGMPDNVNVVIKNERLSSIEANDLIASLDAKAYLDMLEKTFENSWRN